MARRFNAQQTTIVKDLQRVMKNIGATSLRINTPDLLDPDDTGAEIVFDRAGKRYRSQCDTWDHYLDNLRAAQLAIEYTYRIAETYGVHMDDENLMERIFGALEAPLDPNVLALPDGSRQWYEVLGGGGRREQSRDCERLPRHEQSTPPRRGREKRGFYPHQDRLRARHQRQVAPMKKIAPGIHERSPGKVDVRTSIRLNLPQDGDLLAYLLAENGMSIAGKIKYLIMTGGGALDAGAPESEREDVYDLSGLGDEL